MSAPANDPTQMEISEDKGKGKAVEDTPQDDSMQEEEEDDSDSDDEADEVRLFLKEHKFLGLVH